MKTRLIQYLCIFLILSCSSVRNSSKNDIPKISEKYLIITADDFGASKNINEGIEIAADKKAITAISVLTNFIESLPELKQLSLDHPDIGIGVHLNIITGRPVLDAVKVPSLVNSSGRFYTINELLPKLESISPDDLKRELRAQITALTGNNINLDHLSDQDGILSLYGPFFDILTDLAKEFNVPLRTPFIASVKYPELYPDSHLNQRGKQIAQRFALNNPLRAIKLVKYCHAPEMDRKVSRMDELGILHPDLLIDTFWGDPCQTNYLYIIEHLPNGISEIILHVGTSTRQENYPSGLDLGYFENREKELAVATDEHLKELFNNLNIRTIGYSEIKLLSVQHPHPDCSFNGFELF
jgi:chitin disaccharide deacetylase